MEMQMTSLDTMEVNQNSEEVIVENAEAQTDFSASNADYKLISEKVVSVNKSIEELSGEFDKLREKAAESAKIVAQTDSILKYIQSVATQMTLLGFNASIEAKHVGEAGAGFNVIAQEVRQLAEQTSNQTHNIEEVLTNVRSSIASIEQEIALSVDKLNDNIKTVKELSVIIETAHSKANN